MKTAALFFVLIVTISGCSTRDNPTYKKRVQTTSPAQEREESKTSFTPTTNNTITATLYKEYQKWNNTPYKLGGIGLHGVDCSSLVYRVYRDAFGVRLPRTTREQYMRGHRVNRSSAQAGDLIFFKTGYNVRHVGIIVEGTKFMHAAESSGVTISDFSSEYWQSKYWQTRRVLR